MSKIKCKVCSEIKDYKLFEKDKRRKNGTTNRCLECYKVYKREYDRINEDKIKSYNKQWRLENKEYKARKDKEYVEKNRERVLSNKKKYYLKNKDRMRERNKKWVRENKELFNTYRKNYKHRRRALEKDGVSSKELHIWADAQFKICSYCGLNCSSEYHIDHIEPLSKKGKHELNNLTISCKSCNVRKNAKSLVLFMASSNTVSLAMARNKG